MNSNDADFIRQMSERFNRQRGQVLAIHNRALPIALATSEPPLSERINPDDRMQRARGTETVWSNRHPKRGRPDFVVEYTLIMPLPKEDEPHEESLPDDLADDDDIIEPEDRTHKISLRFLNNTGDPVHIKTMYEDKVDNLTQWEVTVKPFGEDRYRGVSDEEFETYVTRANELLDNYPLS